MTNQRSLLISVTSLEPAGNWRKPDTAAPPQRSSRTRPRPRALAQTPSLSISALLGLLRRADAPRPLLGCCGAWLPSKLWSCGVNCSVRATEMWPSPTWRPPSGTDWLSARSSTSTDPTWCESPQRNTVLGLYSNVSPPLFKLLYELIKNTVKFLFLMCQRLNEFSSKCCPSSWSLCLCFLETMTHWTRRMCSRTTGW